MLKRAIESKALIFEYFFPLFSESPNRLTCNIKTSTRVSKVDRPVL